MLSAPAITYPEPVHFRSGVGSMDLDSHIGGPVPTPLAKTTPPTSHGLDIPRALTEELLAGNEPVIAAIALPGAGKTTLLRQWASKIPGPTAWLTLDRTDRDPVVLISDLLSALTRVGVRPEQVMKGITGDEPTFSRRVLPEFCRLLESIGAPVNVVVDDIHEVAESRAAEALKALRRHLPPGSRVAFAGRTAAGMPLARWQAEGAAVLLSADDLVYRPDELSAALAALGRPEVAAEDFASLLESTGGWPVAVYLRCRQGPPAATVRGGEVHAYIAEQILSDLDEQELTFLTQTSVLPALSADLCDEVTGLGNGGVMLAKLARDTPLVRPLGEPGWFAVFPLLRESLLAHLATASSVPEVELRIRASRWFATRGLSEQCVDQALDSGDSALIAEMLWDPAVLALLSGRTATVLNWLDRAGDNAMRQVAELSMLSTWAAMQRGDSPRATVWAQVTAHNLGHDWHLRLAEERVAASFAVFAAIAAQPDPQGAAALAHAAFVALQPGNPLRPLALLAQGLCSALAGDTEPALRLLDDARVMAIGSEVATTIIEAAALLAALDVIQGREPRALHEAVVTWEVHDLRDAIPSTALLSGVQCWDLANRGHSEAATEVMARSRSLTAMVSPLLPWLAPLNSLLHARAFLVLDDPSAAAAEVSAARSSGVALTSSPLLTQFIGDTERLVNAASSLSVLTPAELRVWQLLQGRQTLKEISEGLFLSPETVKSHTSAIYRKLGLASRREAQAFGDSLAAGRA